MDRSSIVMGRRTPVSSITLSMRLSRFGSSIVWKKRERVERDIYSRGRAALLAFDIGKL